MSSKNNNQKKNSKISTIMTPRNLVPSTPMRFNPSSTANLGGTKIIKGPNEAKDKSAVPLPPGYVDRAAQRRLGIIDEQANIFNFEEKKMVLNKTEDEKLKFLEENSGLTGFPSCSNDSIEKFMNLLLKNEKLIKTNKLLNNNFCSNEAFLQFKSIEETKILPFDPFHRPKKVFRASRNLEGENYEDDRLILERVKEALGRLNSTSERNKKYLEALSIESKIESHDIFPDIGRFDGKFKDSEISVTKKSHNRLFKSIKSKKNENESTEDIFNLIAQKRLEDSDNQIMVDKEKDGGGLFGFSDILPKLERLKGEEGNSNKLSGVYASILNEDETENNEIISRERSPDDLDESLYPGYLENDPMNNDSDDEDFDRFEGRGNNKSKRKLAQKEDKSAVKVEKLVKSKFGVDLTK